MHLCFNFNENGSFLHWSGCRRAYAACVRWIMSKIALRWQRGYELLKKSLYFYFLCIQKVFSSLHKIQIEPPMADGFHWRCFSLFSGPQQCYLHGSQMDSHKPSGFYLKYLKLCSEDEQSFYVVGTACGLVNNDKMIILGLRSYIYSNRPKYIVWVNIIHFSFMPKIIRILSKDHVPWGYFVNFLP